MRIAISAQSGYRGFAGQVIYAQFYTTQIDYKYRYGKWVLDASIPTLGSSNTGSNGMAICTSATSEAAYKAFDADRTNAARWNQTPTALNTWIGYHYNTPVSIRKIVASVANTYWDITPQYSDDGVTWTDAASKQHIVAKVSGNDYYITYDNIPYVGHHEYWRVYLEYASAASFGILWMQFYSFQPHGLIPTMTSNNAPYGGVFASSTEGSYAYSAFNDTSYWNTAANVSGSRIGYKFVNPVNVTRFSLWEVLQSIAQYAKPTNIILQYSNDGTNFTDVGTEYFTAGDAASTKTVDMPNDVYALYWAIKIETYNYQSNSGYYGMANRIQFYGRELKPLIPTLTASSENIISDGCYRDQYPSAGANYQWMAFDGNASTWWLSRSGVSDRYLGWDFGKKTSIKYFSLYGLFYGLSYPMYFMGSDDGETWETLYTIPAGTGGTSAGATCTVAIDANYRMYKFQTYLAYSSGTRYVIDIYSLQLYGSDYSQKEFEPNSSRLTVYDHGVKIKAISDDLSADGFSWGSGGYSIFATEQRPQTLYNDGSRMTSSSFPVIVVKDLIDVTPYKRLYVYIQEGVNYTSSGNTYYNTSYGVAPTKAVGNTVAVKNNAAFLETFLDITSVNQLVYIQIQTSWAAAKASISEIWLE